MPRKAMFAPSQASSPPPSKKPRCNYAQPTSQSTTQFQDLLSSVLWTHVVMPLLASPRTLVGLGQVNKPFHAMTSDDALWRPFVEKIEDGNMKGLTDGHALRLLGKKLKHAFMAASTTTSECCRQRCGRFVHCFTLTRICWTCYDAKIQAKDPLFTMISKSRAKEEYLLTDKAIKELCTVIEVAVGGRARPLSILISRKQAEQAACARFPGEGMAGLLAEKERRKAKAQERYDRAMAVFDKKKKEHLTQPDRKPMPKLPNRPRALDAAEIGNDAGGLASAYPAAALIFTFGAVDKNTGEATGNANGWVMCKRCLDNLPNTKQAYMLEVFDDYETLWESHLEAGECPYYDPEPDWGCGCGCDHGY